MQADLCRPGAWTGIWQSDPYSGKACDNPLVELYHPCASVNILESIFLAVLSLPGDSLPMCKCWLETRAGRGHLPLPGFVIQRHLLIPQIAIGYTKKHVLYLISAAAQSSKGDCAEELLVHPDGICWSILMCVSLSGLEPLRPLCCADPTALVSTVAEQLSSPGLT